SIKFQISPESMWNYHNERSCATFHADPLINHGSSQDWQIMKKMTVPLENSPEFAGHSEHDARVRNVRKRRFLLIQPLECGSVSATSAESRFASMVATPHFRFGGIELPPQCCSTAIEYHGKILTDRWASSRPVPNGPRYFKDLF